MKGVEGQPVSVEVLPQPVGVVPAAPPLEGGGEQRAARLGERARGPTDADDVGELHAIEAVEGGGALLPQHLPKGCLGIC